ncbi:MAG: hypothetical protein KatS3mg056_2378 [Chloroflexus sp.]|nr:MAG: hypothetical protein KatS3mg056_2378 [Chloroflexus sp.]
MAWGSSLHPGSNRHPCHYSQAGSYPTARHYERVTGAYATPSRHPSRRGDTLPLGARASGAPSPACQECLPSHTNISLNKVHCSGVILVQKRYRVYSWRVARGLPSVRATACRRPYQRPALHRSGAASGKPVAVMTYTARYPIRTPRSIEMPLSRAGRRRGAGGKGVPPPPAGAGRGGGGSAYAGSTPLQHTHHLHTGSARRRLAQPNVATSTSPHSGDPPHTGDSRPQRGRAGVGACLHTLGTRATGALITCTLGARAPPARMVPVPLPHAPAIHVLAVWSAAAMLPRQPYLRSGACRSGYPAALRTVESRFSGDTVTDQYYP